MSRRNRRRGNTAPRAYAVLFAALGDATRLALVVKLSTGEAQSITELTQGSRLTRQAITKHLQVLEDAGMVLCERAGRENRFWLDPEPLREIRKYVDAISRQWDEALARLKYLVES